MVTCHAELIPHWLHTQDGVEDRRSFIDSERLKKLRKVDLLTEKPDLSVAQAARIAWTHLKKYNANHAKYEVFQVHFENTTIGDKEVSYYRVWFQQKDYSDIVLERRGEPLRSEHVFVMLDGKVLKIVPEATWKTLAEQDGADQPATDPESKPEDSEKPQPESEARSQ